MRPAAHPTGLQWGGIAFGMAAAMITRPAGRAG